jgi:hypothetical protein
MACFGRDSLMERRHSSVRAFIEIRPDVFTSREDLAKETERFRSATIITRLDAVADPTVRCVADDIVELVSFVGDFRYLLEQALDKVRAVEIIKANATVPAPPTGGFVAPMLSEQIREALDRWSDSGY